MDTLRDGGRLSKVTILQRHLKSVSLCGQHQTLQCAYRSRCEEVLQHQSENHIPFMWLGHPYARRKKERFCK